MAEIAATKDAALKATVMGVLRQGRHLVEASGSQPVGGTGDRLPSGKEPRAEEEAS
jgi:hypothetical protein